MKRFIVLFVTVMVLTVSVVSAQPQAQAVPAVTTAAGPVWAAWQPFQNGVMMWWSDTDQVWAMQNNGAVIVQPDTWQEGMGNPTSSCAITPVRGFGQMWARLNLAGISLGCALAPEIGYDTAARILSGSEIVIDGPGETLYGVTIQAGANTGSWRVIRIY